MNAVVAGEKDRAQEIGTDKHRSNCKLQGSHGARDSAKNLLSLNIHTLSESYSFVSMPQMLLLLLLL